MRTKSIKVGVVFSFLVLIALFVILRGETKGVGLVEASDAAATYKKDCMICHSPKAEKFYDPNMPEDEQIEIVLKGKKMEKPPHMPGYEAKGMKREQAKELVEYMMSLRRPAE